MERSLGCEGNGNLEQEYQDQRVRYGGGWGESMEQSCS